MPKFSVQALKRVFMHVSHLPPPHFDFKKSFYRRIGFLSKYYGGTLETCLNVRFRLRNARLCMSQAFPHHILILKKLKSNWFFYQNMVGEDLRHDQT